VHELASGVDALYLSGRGALQPGFLERLGEACRFADDVRLPVPFELGEPLLALRPHAFGRYRYCLDGEGLRVGVSPSAKLPCLRVQPRAELLHASGPGGTLPAVAALLGPVCEGLALSTSRLDLFVDVEGWRLAGTDRHRFVCRGDALRTYETNGRFTGFAFGSRTTKIFTARCYDKTAEIAAKGNDWWLALWGARHRPGERVLRVELEIGREALREFGVSSPEDVLAAAGDLWHYGTGEWLTPPLRRGIVVGREPRLRRLLCELPLAWRAVDARGGSGRRHRRRAGP
jgi:hypothetical protein